MLSHGAAERMGDLAAYYRHILHGRAPRPERLQALADRYRAIGGTSPLNRLTRKQAAQIARTLSSAGMPARAYVGFQHTPPWIGDAVQQMIADGIRHAAVLVMTPYYSPLGTGRYLSEVWRECEQRKAALAITCIERWDDEPEFLDLLEVRLRAALQAVAGPGPRHVIFTAHSLPVLEHNRNDPYVDQFTAAARALAERLHLERWSTCYQSASDNGLPWLGPDILEEVERVHATGARRLVVCPSSFAADNLEVLYDIGIEARRRAVALGLAFAQTAPLNDDPAFTGFLARVLARRLSGATAVFGTGVRPVAAAV